VRDTDLYKHLLGLSDPWKVTRVELDVEDGRVDVWAEHGRGERFACPECGTACGVYDHSEERSWRHLDSCQFRTFLHCRPPRVRCDEHGVKQARLPWAEPHSRFTLLFERLAIDVLRETSITSAARILGLSWDEVFHVMERAVVRGQSRKERKPLRLIGVDEKSTRKGQRYMTLVCDLEEGTVEYVAEGRKKASLDGFFDGLEPEQRQGIEAVAMDMWEPFIASTKDKLPEGASKIVFDRFHIMMHMNDAVDRVRRAEHRFRSEWGLDTLKKTKHLWLYAEENVPEKHADRFEELRESNLKTAKAWAIKEQLRGLWENESHVDGYWYWKRWNDWATRSRLEPVVKVAKMVRTRLPNILTYFGHRITNAAVEGINSVVQTIKRTARGFRNQAHFQTAIFFRCGGLDLYPEHRTTHALPG